MNRSDLFDMLDLDGSEPTTSDPLTIVSAGAGKPTKPTGPSSQTALKLDKWGLRRGADALEASYDLQVALEVCGNEDDQACAAADFHGAAFEPEPILNERCDDELRGEFVKQLLDTPEYHSLHAATMLNETASELAALAFAKQFAALKEDHENKTGKPRDRSSGKLGAMDDEITVLKAVGKAVDEASKDVEEQREATAAMGMGAGPSGGGSTDPKAIAALFKRIRSSKTLRAIVDAAGRFRRVAQSKQRLKTTHGLDDMVGVTLDNDLGRLLPSEAALLTIPELEDDVLRRYVERQLLCREHRSVEPVGKGPVLFVIDESGSMHGEKVRDAKAIALAMAWVARSQKRWCGLIAYSGKPRGGGFDRVLALPPGRWDENALMDWLEDFLSGGSDLDVPVNELPEMYKRIGAPAGVTDVVIITDAICRIPQKSIEKFNAWKTKAKARVITLVIQNNTGDLSLISDETHIIPALTAESEAIGRVLSI